MGKVLAFVMELELGADLYARESEREAVNRLHGMGFEPGVGHAGGRVGMTEEDDAR